MTLKKLRFLAASAVGCGAILAVSQMASFELLKTAHVPLSTIETFASKVPFLIEQALAQSVIQPIPFVQPANFNPALYDGRLITGANYITGRRIYVAVSGSDNSGTGSSTQPFATLAKAITSARVGDEIFVANGTYALNQQVLVPVGVSIRGASTTGTIFRPGSNWNPNVLSLFALVDQSFPNPIREDGRQILSYFTIDGNNRTLKEGIRIFSRHNVRIDHVTIRQTSFAAVWARGPYEPAGTPIPYMRGIEIAHNRFENCASYPSGGSSSGCVYFGNLEEPLIHDNVIVTNDGYGIKGVEGSEKRMRIYRNNVTVSNNAPQYGAQASIEVFRAQEDSRVFDNTVNQWTSFVKGPLSTPGQLQLSIYRNRILFTVDNKEGIEIVGSGIDVYQNTIVNADVGFAVFGWEDPRVRYVHIRNNTVKRTLPNNIRRGAIIGGQGNLSDIWITNNYFENLDTALDLYTNAGQQKTFSNFLIANNVVVRSKSGVTTNGSGSLYRNYWVTKNSFLNTPVPFRSYAVPPLVLRNM